MYKIVNGKGTGKTKALLVKAADEGAIVICADPDKMRERALRYHLLDIDIRSYDEFSLELGTKEDVYIHDIDYFLRVWFGNQVKGYTMTYEP